jgi:predicted O-methyltransferase YrrM
LSVRHSGAVAARRAFFRSKTIRRAVAAVRSTQDRRDSLDLAHLALFDEEAVGPVQRDEALLLHALARVLRPRTVVEVGFLRGYSALNFLRALDADARLYSFDIDPSCEHVARELFGYDNRFVFRTRSQDALTANDLDSRDADLVFLDASHELALNQRTFQCLLPLMARDAILAVHDTGTMPRQFVPADHWWLQTTEGWVGDAREVMPDERAFVNWLLDEHPTFSQIHFHSQRTRRYGITLLQRSAPLPRPDHV